MAGFLGIIERQTRIRHTRGERTNRRLVFERLESRTVLDAGLTPGTGTTLSATAGTLVTGAPLVTFTDGTAPLPANEYSATIDWGDGTPLSGGAISVSGKTFTITGSHNFAEPSTTQSGGVYTVSVEIVGDRQQVSTTTTATVGGFTYGYDMPPILPIPIEPEPAEFEPVAGSPIGGLTLGPFQASSTPDPNAYSAVVDWGDGSTPTVASIEEEGSGALFANTSGHNYAAAGNYTITTTLRDSQGFVVGTGEHPMYIDNPSAIPPPLAAEADSPTGPLTVAEILVIGLGNNFDSSYYTAVVDWGDGSPPVDATFTTLDNFELGVTTSGHTYAQGGTYSMTVTIRDVQGVVVDSVNPTITVSDLLSGRLVPQSNASASQQADITNVSTPTFRGNTSPGATVEVFAAPAGSPLVPGRVIAVTTADGSGAWSATAANPMADGT
jgi:large repetitive protein